jgi:gliding motility-associated-like protein
MKKIFLILILTLSVSCLMGQTFSNTEITAVGSWNASLTKTVTVSGLPTTLQNGIFELFQVNLHMGDATTRNYNTYRVRLTKGTTTIDLIATGGLPNSTITQFNSKFRYNTYLKRLFEHGGTTVPFEIGYYRSQDDFQAFNGIDPNGDWTVTITETSTATGGRFNKVDLVFGPPALVSDYTTTTSYDNCSTPYCLGINEIIVASNNGFTPQAGDMFNGNTTGCSWNAAQNNSAWFKFIANNTNIKITISGITSNIQILAFSGGADNNPCTPADNVVLTGGCPASTLNDTYASPQYLNGSSRNNQLNLSGLSIGQTYYFLVDGTGGAISPFYIEIEGASPDCSNCTFDPIVSSNSPVCAGSSISITCDDGTSWSWTGPNGFSSNLQNPTIPVATIANSGTYTVIAIKDGCNVTKTANVVVNNIPAIPTASVSSQPSCIAATGTITITLPLPAIGITYTIAGTSSQTNDTGIFSGLNPGVYNVTVSQNGCTSLPLQLMVNQVPGNEFYDFASAVRINSTIYNTHCNATPALGGQPGFTAIENQINPSPGALFFHGSNLGNYNHYSNTLRITGGEIKTIKTLLGNVCGATMHWKVYPIGSDPLAVPFNNYALTDWVDCTHDSDSNGSPDTFGDLLGPCRNPFYQKLKNFNTGIDLTQRCAGGYKLEVYYSYIGSSCSTSGCEETKIITNGATNFIADFSINPVPAPTAISPQTFCSSANPTIANLIPSGTSINWYSAATGGTPITTNTALLNNTTYYASQTINNCEGIARTPVLVNINIQPNAGSNGTLSICSTSTLTETLLFNALGNSPVNGGSWTPTLAGEGVYTYTVNGIAPCSNSTATVTVSFNNPTAPTIGTITQTTCTSAGSVALSGLPAIGTWTVTAFPGGATLTGTGTTANFANLSPNTTYTFTVTNADDCASSPSNSVVLNNVPGAPVLNITSTDNTSCSASTCIYTGPIAYINEILYMPGSTFALPPTPGDNTNAAVQSMYNASGTGQEWIEIYNPSPCDPLDLSCYVVGSHTGATNTGAFAFPAGTIIPPLGFLTVGAGSSVDINLATFLGTPNLVGSNRWHLENGCGYILLANPSGNIIDAVYWSQNNAADLTANTTCGGSFNRTLNVPPACSPTINPLPAAKDIPNIVYAGNFGATAQGPSNIGKSISRTTDGSSAFIISNQIGGTPQGCNAGPTNCTPPFTGSVCNGTATVNVTIGSGNYSYQWSASANNQTTQTATALCAGTHSVVVTDTTTNCESTISVTINTIVPATPTASVTAQPTCLVSTGTFQINNFNPAFAYNFTPAVVSISPTGLVTANSGTYTFTVTNIANCTSGASANIVVNPQPPIPAAPSISGAVTQPTCLVSTGTFQINNFNPAFTYSFIPAVVSISPTGLVTANSGTYTFTVTNIDNCTSGASVNIVVNPQPPIPAAPSISGAVTQPTCLVSTGTFQINNFNPAFTYSFIPAVVSISPTGLVTANSGTYTFTVTNIDNCTSGASVNIVVNPQPPIPAAPSISGAVTQPTCLVSTGTFQINNFNPAFTYSFIPAVVSISSTGLVTANSGTYTFTVTNIDNCTSGASASIILNIPNSPQTPIVEVSLPTCDEVGRARIVNYNSSFTYFYSNTNPLTVDSNGYITGGFSFGTSYIVTANQGTCISANSNSFIIDNKLGPAGCIIPQGISPNNDGKNDRWNIEFLNAKRVEIFNRWGMMVYSKNNYKNEWEGQTDKGEILPDGTYYWIIYFEDKESQAGWVYKNSQYN